MIVPTIDLGGNPLATFWEEGVNAILVKVIGRLRKLIGSPETGVILESIPPNKLHVLFVLVSTMGAFGDSDIEFQLSRYENGLQVVRSI